MKAFLGSVFTVAVFAAGCWGGWAFMTDLEADITANVEDHRTEAHP